MSGSNLTWVFSWREQAEVLIEHSLKRCGRDYFREMRSGRCSDPPMFSDKHNRITPIFHAVLAYRAGGIPTHRVNATVNVLAEL